MAPRKKSSKTVKPTAKSKQKSDPPPEISSTISSSAILHDAVQSSDTSSSSYAEQGLSEHSQPGFTDRSTGAAPLHGAVRSSATLNDIMGDSVSNEDSLLDEEPSSTDQEAARPAAAAAAKPKPKPKPNDRRKQSQPRDLKVLKEMLHLQNTVANVIPRLSFGRVIREILNEYSPSGMRVTRDMLECLQEAAELYMVQLLEDSYRCTLHRDRMTLQPKDIQLALMLRRGV